MATYKWQPDDIRRLAADPTYTGIGPFPRIVPDDLWIKAAVNAIAQDGAEQFLGRVLSALHERFPAKQS